VRERTTRIRYWPLDTPVEFTIPTVALVSDVQLTPDEGSQFHIRAPKYVVLASFPAEIRREDTLAGEELVTLPLDSALSEGVVRLELASPLAQNVVVAKLTSLSLWSALGWILGLFWVTFEDEAKAFLRRRFQRKRTEQA
jgi:hypothetical protein